MSLNRITCHASWLHTLHCVKVHSFIIAKGIYCQARDDGGIKRANRRADWIHTFHSAWFWQMTRRQQQKGKKKKKFSKPTKKMGEELAAKKRCQQNFGSSEIEYRRKLKSTLAARGQRPWESGHFTLCLKRHRNCRYQTALNGRAGLTI